MRLGIRHLLVAAVSLLAAQVAVAQGISGTKHDFSGKGWGSTELCIFCHTPHNAKSTAQLWNHAESTQTYSLYGSGTFNATPGQPGATSKLCLSCHDGTVAVDSFGTRTGTNFVTGSAALGTGLDNDHPIGFSYNAALVTADGGGLVSPASASLAATDVPLYAEKVECGSCHNVHNNTYAPFLRVSNAASALCLKCHIK